MPPLDITPFFSAPLLDEKMSVLARSDESAIDSLIDTFGCRGGVYWDVGSNIGLQISKLYEPELYHGNKAEPEFAKAFGPPPRCGVCTIALEPNPSHAPRLTTMSQRYRAAGIGVLFLPVAASDSDGFVDFYINVSPMKAGREPIDLGASASPLKAVHQLARFNEQSNATRVRCADLSRLVLHLHRKLVGAGGMHRQQLKTAQPVAMKLDTEFLEFRLLPHLTWTLALCAAVDSVMVDWSNLALGQSAGRRPQLTRPAVHAAASLRAALTDAYDPARRGAHCRTSLIDLDDETYVTGGMRFPTAPAPNACRPRDRDRAPPPRMGYCSFTPEVKPTLKASECDAGGSVNRGAVRAETLDECVALCKKCAACRFVSFSHEQKECGWFRSCDWDNLQQTHGVGFRTLQVRSTPVRS
jgi:hypothetical protein